MKNFFERREPQKGLSAAPAWGCSLASSDIDGLLLRHYADTPPAFASARRTSVCVSGTLYAFFESGSAPSSASRAAPASASASSAFPFKNPSAFGTRQGTGA